MDYRLNNYVIASRKKFESYLQLLTSIERRGESGDIELQIQIKKIKE